MKKVRHGEKEKNYALSLKRQSYVFLSYYEVEKTDVWTSKGSILKYK